MPFYRNYNSVCRCLFLPPEIIHDLNYIFLFILLFIGVVESIRHRKLTLEGGLAGGLVGFFVFIGAGWMGIGMLALFFLSGTMATSWKRKQKAQVGLAQEKGGQRTLGQVMANGGVPALIGLLALFFPQQQPVFPLLIAGAFSAAIADTLSSELGTVYGRYFYNIITWKKDQRGLDGVVSLEGTAIGIAGSVLMAIIYSISFGWSQQFSWIVVAGTVANLADSFLGATLERKQIIGNNTVNFLNTAIGALVVYLLR